MTDWMRPVPNALTVLRLVAAGLLPFVPASWRLPLIVFAGASDLLDGYVARRFDAVTRWGTLFDGIARHTQEGLDFVKRAGEVGFRDAVRERDDPFQDYGSRPKK